MAAVRELGFDSSPEPCPKILVCRRSWERGVDPNVGGVSPSVLDINSGDDAVAVSGQYLADCSENPFGYVSASHLGTRVDTLELRKQGTKS